MRVVAGRAFDIVEVELHACRWSPLSRKRGSVAVSTTGSRTMTSPDGAADLVLGPGHRHHPRGAGEVRNVERDLGGAVGPTVTMPE